MTAFHIAVMGKKPLEKIMNGDRTIEPRFLKKPVQPFDSVNIDDVIYFKSNDGYAVARATVTKVENYGELTPQQVIELLDRYKMEIAPSDMMYDTKIYSKFATLIWFENVQEIRPFYVKNPEDQKFFNWTIVEDINSLRAL